MVQPLAVEKLICPYAVECKLLGVYKCPHLKLHYVDDKGVRSCLRDPCHYEHSFGCAVFCIRVKERK